MHLTSSSQLQINELIDSTMDTVTQSQLNFAERQHRKTTSSVLKSIISPRSRNRGNSAVLQPFETNRETFLPANCVLSSNGKTLPPSNPCGRQQFGDGSKNRENVQPSFEKPVEVYEDKPQGFSFHKKSKSSVSLKSLIGAEKAEPPKTRSPKKQEQEKPKKKKSSTGLSALLSRPKSSKDLRADMSRQQKDKENMTPPDSADIAPPPIWAQFARHPTQEISVARKIPLNDAHDVDDEMALYTPHEYSPSKQRNFHDSQKPTLSRKGERPKSAFLGNGISTTSFAETISGLRKYSHDRGESRSSNQSEQHRKSVESSRKSSSECQYPTRLDRNERRKVSDSSSNSGIVAKRGSRVMAVVAAFNGRSKESGKENADNKVDPKEIEIAFENLLDSRNVPQHTRDKMRALDTNIKADFIKQNKTSSGTKPKGDGLCLHASEINQASHRPFSGKRSKIEDGCVAAAVEAVEVEAIPDVSRKSRPRSRTFTLSKSDPSPSKKQKEERPKSRGRPTSTDLTLLGASRSSTSTGPVQTTSVFGKTTKALVPDDFILYLKKVQRPEEVEVGRLQKLRQLLRNETVTWVDGFITRGGMKEIEGLLYRIIQVEWREEHEDTLLHETLLCLKAISTTSLAIHELSTIQSHLFPTLLGMLFDQEKKGPSEFITRNIIISLLFTYLSSSTSTDMPTRARTLLSYLRDPSQPEAAQPPGWIAEMHQPRPYRVWCKELVNVTKEVFWIFLHHLNIIPYPPTPEHASSAGYTADHFPRERLPVPAAPYVGGVEWEATNYLASHLDLLNGIIAALPSQEERNRLRMELRDSGFEKCMGVSLRTCKEKFYGSVHAGLTTWMGAAREDRWDATFVREGPKREEIGHHMRGSPTKKGLKDDGPPKLEIPKLDLVAPKVDSGFADGGWM